MDLLTPSTSCRSVSPAFATCWAEPKCCNNFFLREGPIPEISSRRDCLIFFCLFARCVPIAKRCASSLRRWRKCKTLLFPDKEKGSFSKSKFKGEYIRYYSNGKIEYIGNYNNLGDETGVVQYFHKNGNLSLEYTVKNKLLTGKLTRYFEDGSLESSI